MFAGDSDWGAASGIVIYKIDEAASAGATRGYPGHPNWPRDHLRVTVLQADGNYDIEKGENLGDRGDFWRKGGKLSPGPTWPNTDAYGGGNVRRTGITIEILSDSQYIMLFKVTGVS